MVASIEPECIPMFIPFSSDIRISFTRFGLQSEYDTFPNILRYSTRQHTIQSNIKKQIEKNILALVNFDNRVKYDIGHVQKASPVHLKEKNYILTGTTVS